MGNETLKVSWINEIFVATFHYHHKCKQAIFTFTTVNNNDDLEQIQFVSNEQDMLDNIKKFNELMMTSQIKW